MELNHLNKEKWGKWFALFAISISFIMIITWRSYETRILYEASQVPKKEMIEYDSIPLEDKIAKINMLEKMAMAERQKIKVMVEHDNSPLTDTYPMIMDATNSFDPDVGDELQYVWKQIAGETVDIRPNPFSGKVSFEAKAGEYTFELTVSDDYGSKATVTRTVIIEPEPNMPPVIDMKVRQGSELN